MSSITFTVNAGRQQRRNQPNNWRRRPQKQKKPFCKICFDSNKPEVVYTGHYLKDRPGPKGVVVCPTLLTTECRYCKVTGHFKSHCPELKSRKSDQANRAKAQSVNRHQAFEAGEWMTVADSTKLTEAVLKEKLQRKTRAMAAPTKSCVTTSVFALLDSSDEEDEVNLVYARGPSVALPRQAQGAWAQCLKSPPQVKEEETEYDKMVELNAQCAAVFNSPTFITTAEHQKASVPAENQERIGEIQAELVNLHADLASETQAASGSWADQSTIDDLEEKIGDLETELAGLQTIFLC